MMGQYSHHYPGGAGAAGLPTLENLMPMAFLDQFLADPGFAKRAARLSGFDGRGSYGPGQFGLLDDDRAGALRETELGNARDEFSVSSPTSAGAGMALKGVSTAMCASRRPPARRGKARTAPCPPPRGRAGEASAHSSRCTANTRLLQRTCHTRDLAASVWFDFVNARSSDRRIYPI
jgi:hypothetical protein